MTELKQKQRPSFSASSASPREIVLLTEHTLLAAYLERWCRGRAAARPKWRIRQDLVAAGCRIGERIFDQFAAELVLTGHPVGSCGGDESGEGRRQPFRPGLDVRPAAPRADREPARGFFWCVEEADYDLAYHYLVGRFEPMRQRAEALRRQKEARFPEAELLFEIAPHGHG